jgi:hypothetical protein
MKPARSLDMRLNGAADLAAYRAIAGDGEIANCIGNLGRNLGSDLH